MMPELTRRHQSQARVRMHRVEVLERCWQLAQNRGGISQVHPAEVIAPECVDEALGHAVALRAAHRRVDGLKPQLPRDLLGVGGSSLRHWKSSPADTPSCRATSDTDMPGSYVLRTSAAFSATVHRLRRWSVLTT